MITEELDRNDKAFEKAVAAGCRPVWYDGMLGPRWHCGCDDLDHACDQQCSVVKFYFKVAK